jgi:putative membrane protein insertion efficiency factor
VAALLGLDARREPSRQLSASAWVAGVRAYQRLGRPLLEGRVRCRYVPTCSQYSIEAVERHGIARGLALTADRLSRCRRSVPLGTPDPLRSDLESRDEEDRVAERGAIP